MKKVKKVYIRHCKEDDDWEFYRTERSAKKTSDAGIGLIDSACSIENFIGFTPSKTKVTEITFKTLR